MNTGYETVVDPATIVWTAIALVIHVVIVLSQLGLSLLLITTGLHNLFFPSADTAWTRRVGGIAIVSSATSKVGALRVALGIALLLPIALSFSFAASLLACFGSIALLVFLERGIPEDVKPQGRLVRRVATMTAVVVGAFMLWEGEDGLDLGVEVLANTQTWRVHELEWQLANDVEAPKVGELAPDFELLDPSGQSVVRLADFREKRPVALIFGSYT